MRPSTSNAEPVTLGELTRSPDYATRVCGVLAQVAQASDEPQVVHLLKQAVHCLGAEVGLFTSFIRDDATRSSYRHLLACDPLWRVEYDSNDWFNDDPWLQHALVSSEPVRASELQLVTPQQNRFAQTIAELGFQSAVIVPAPSPAGQSRIGMLCLGSSQRGFFEDDGYPMLRILARPLAMELHEWMHRRARQALLARVRITDDELALLRHEEAGHTSKVIAAALHTEAKTIDCRFQRLNAKLGAANRRDAYRLAKLYGLI